MTTENNDNGKARQKPAGGKVIHSEERTGVCGQQGDFGKPMLPRKWKSLNSGEAEPRPDPPKKPADWVETDNLQESAPSKGGGFIYVMKNPCYPHDCYKIGRSKDVERRRRDFNTSAPEPYGVVMSLRVNNAAQAESDLHKSLEDKGYRIGKTEFFKLPQGRLEEVLTKFARKKLRLWKQPK